MKNINFAMIGAAGYIAPKHLEAIRATGNQLVAAVDPKDSVGILDRFFPDARFFTEIERFDRHLEKLRRTNHSDKVEMISICSPNYLHDAHVRLALRLGAHAICEKPLVINPWNVEALEELEAEHKRRIFTVLQLRLLPVFVELRKKIASQKSVSEVELNYVTSRGPWYQVSWKGDVARSGGIATNIGIHFFDLLTWIFGKPAHSELHLTDSQRMSGFLELEKARVKWFLSINRNDLPSDVRQKGKGAFRSLKIDGQEIEFSESFTNLHIDVYRDILNGGGFSLRDAKAAIEIVHQIRSLTPVSPRSNAHPFLKDAAA